MKKLIAVVVILGLWFCGPTIAYAGGSYDCSSGFWSKVANKCVTHPSFPERRNPVGLGADVVLFEGAEGEVLDQVHTEYRWDFQNDEHSVFAVATTKLEDVWNAVQRLWGRSSGGE